ncbi:hypothetical protein GCM10027449_22200 [Sinomonas notoginsengisoli]|uniref:hypothetical protein n=1 Tax=Sinomonas notoginsengisoli TaxID=1457311 RepID=UPI001F266C35|nr:hypothetical protein [Sinomonas notoginsengisoli]
MNCAPRPRSRSLAVALLRTGAAGALAAAFLAAPMGPASAAPDQSQGIAWGRSMHVDSHAIPTPKRPTATDSKAVWGTLRANGGPASASATAHTTCPGCSGTATTLQVLTSDSAPAVQADNVATAFTTADRASSSAVSVQIVETADMQSLMADNRAVSVNLGCTGCVSSSVALQFVIVGVPARELSPTARAIVLQIEQALTVDLTSASSTPKSLHTAHARSVAALAAQRTQAVIGADTGTGVQTRMEVDCGD